MKRRAFITLLGGAAAAWPLAARAQQSVVPVIGFLDPRTPEAITDRLRGFRQGLKEAGFVEGETWQSSIAMRSINSNDCRGWRSISFAVKSGCSSRQAGLRHWRPKRPPRRLPLSSCGDDPVRLGLVTSLARPEGNLTGINVFNSELATKRLEFLRVLVPTATRISVL